MSAGDEKPRPMDEFALIEKLFVPLAGPGAFGLKDDAALVRTSPGCDLIVTKDAIAEGRHYLADDPPGDVARKLLRVNLSDLAAKGARPIGYLLACAWNEATSFDWMVAFSEALLVDQKFFGLSLLGGDTIKTEGPSVFSLTAFGEVPHGKMVRRAGAQVDDEIYVTGTIGDAALGLLVARGKLVPPDRDAGAYLVGRYRVPEPPAVFGTHLSEVASAALDVSDGLLSDLQHLCEASGVGAVLHQAQIPLSDSTARLLEQYSEHWNTVFAGGDDYQTLFTAAPKKAGRIETMAVEMDMQVTRIGRATSEQGISVLDFKGERLEFTRNGFSHF